MILARPRPRSLRGRFSVLAVVVAAGTAAVLGTAFVAVLERRLDRSAHELLAARVEAASDLFRVTADGRVVVLDRAGDPVLDEGAWVYRGRRLVARSAGPAELQSTVGRLAGTTGFRRGPDDTLLLAQPLPDDGPRVGTVVGALSLKGNADAVDLVQALVLGLGLLVMAGAGGATYVLVGRALRPVVALTRQAADWSATDVGRRFGSAERPTELGDLAATLDGVLDRLSAVLRHEQQLTGELSHELRTPLARIVAEAELLQARPRSAGELADAHAAIAASAARMDRILSTLLTTARSGADSPPGRASALAVARVVAAAADDPRIRVTGPDVVVGVDAAVLERILAPLVDNAARYARRTVVLEVTGTPSVLVHDDGPGLPDALLETVFDPGRRARPDDGHSGAGLGLALSRRLARASGADVVLTCAPGGSGVTAVVHLPGG